jgi:hypothetical protein
MEVDPGLGHPQQTLERVRGLDPWPEGGRAYGGRA